MKIEIEERSRAYSTVLEVILRAISKTGLQVLKCCVPPRNMVWIHFIACNSVLICFQNPEFIIRLS